MKKWLLGFMALVLLLVPSQAFAATTATGDTSTNFDLNALKVNGAMYVSFPSDQAVFNFKNETGAAGATYEQWFVYNVPGNSYYAYVTGVASDQPFELVIESGQIFYKNISDKQAKWVLTVNHLDYVSQRWTPSQAPLGKGARVSVASDAAVYYEVFKKVVPVGGGGGGQPGGIDGDGLEIPVTPSPPDSSWDLIGWVKYIVDWVIYLVKVLIYYLGRIGVTIGKLLSSSQGFMTVFTKLFGWLPPEYASLLTMGLVSLVIVGLVRR